MTSIRPLSVFGICSVSPVFIILLLSDPAVGQEPRQQIEEFPGIDRLTESLKEVDTLDRLSPTWLYVHVDHRTRYETYDNSWRKGQSGGNTMVQQRTRAYVKVQDILDPLQFVLEMADFRTPVARRGLDDEPLFVNHMDFYQLHADLVTDNLMGSGLPFKIEFGRLVMDYGKGRLIAGHRWGPFTPTFDGMQLHLGSTDKWLFRGFATAPVQQHSVSLDKTESTYFWGIDLLSAAPLTTRPLKVEVYYFGLSERGRSVQSGPNIVKPRELSTLGFRLFEDPSAGRLDYEMESTYQFGQVGSLDRFAHRHHGEVGYSFELPWKPRFVYFFDYASGDSDPTDSKSGAFDFLFAKRRFEFGPTGILGIIFPSNILAPAGFMLTASPGYGLALMMSHRAYWLAESEDVFVGSGLQDPSGRADSFLGNQFECRVIYKPTGPYWRHAAFDIGYSHFFKGDYFDEVPDTPGTSDVNYVYTMATVNF